MRSFPLVLALALLAGCPAATDKPVDTDDTNPPRDTDTAHENGAPSAPEIAITPAAPADAQDLAVTILTPAVDPDGDEVSYRYTWRLDGTVREDLTSEDVPASETVDGQSWEVIVTPSDGSLDGDAATATVVIGNAAPSAPVVRIAPDAPTPDQALELVFDAPAVDPDGDTLTQTIDWFVNEAAAVSYADQTTIPGNQVDSGETWRAVVTVTDGLNTPVLVETSVTVGNTPPTLDTPTITPSTPKDDTPLQVSVSASDPDGDDLAYTYVWYRDGAEAVDVGNTDTVPATATTIGEEWAVVVTVSDGIDDVNASAATVSILEWSGYTTSQTFTAWLAQQDGTFPTAEGEWTSRVSTRGTHIGENECDLVWAVEAAEDRSVCFGCDFAFSGTMTVDRDRSTGTGAICDALAGDGTVKWALAEPTPAFHATGLPVVGGYEYPVDIYAYGTGGYNTSYGGRRFARYYSVTTEADTDGNVTIEAYTYAMYQY